MEARRVLFFAASGALDGPAWSLLCLADWLGGHGWSPTVVTTSEGPLVEQLRARGIDAIVDPNFREMLKTRGRAFDIVVANTLAAWPVVRAAYEAGRPVVWFLHETHLPNELAKQTSEIRATLYLADLLITPSRRLAELYEGMAQASIEVLPYGVPEPTPLAKRSAGDAVKFFVPAAADRTKLPGRFDGAANLEDADALICLSPERTTLLPVLEAMSQEKPVICGDGGDAADWLRDGMNSWLVNPNDPTSVARAITACVEDPAGRARIGAAARRTYERHFTMERFGSEFAARLERTIRSHGQPRVRKPHNYTAWIEQYGRLTREEKLAIRRRLRALRQNPRISIVLPVYNPDLKFLAAALGSVRQQIYENWELCLADDASTDARVKPFLERMAAFDARIRVTFRESNGHISAASNSAVALAAGEWCAFLDQDDRLAEDALARVALELAEHPGARLFYSDEDKIDVAGERSNPYFKPDWNPELFLGQNFVNHLAVYEMKLVREVGGLREGFEGSQDYDLAARCVDRLRPDQIRHIPRILYHWRSVPGSLAGQVDAKPYARDAARRALQDHLTRQGIAGKVEACRENKELHRVVYALPDPPPLVSVIIPLRDRVELLRRCLESFRLTNYAPVEILLVDNGSRDEETLSYLRELETPGSAKILRDDGLFNFSRLNNEAARQARGEILAFLNNDIEITEPNWLREMVSHAARVEVGAVGARLWYRDETLQHGGVVLGLGGVAGHAHHRVPRGHQGYFSRAFLSQNVGAVTGACLVTRREVFEQVGGFNERDLGINFNDIEYCVRLRARGLQVIWTPYANLRHDESGSRGHHRAAAEQAQFFREANFIQEHYGDALLHDPAYNPNLSLLLPGYELAFPPRN